MELGKERILVDDHTEIDIMKLMKQSLPLYIVNCFDAAGYDTADAICEMNSDSSIREIEDYIEKHKSYLPHCMRYTNDTISPLPFKFPPGHRIIISKFISTVKKSFHQKPKECQKISKTSSKTDPGQTTQPQPKRAKVYEDIPTVTEEIRRKIIKWAKRYENGESNDTITESKDYTIKVRKSPDPSLCYATIECRCGNSYVVTRNPKGEHQITNWCRHFKTCGSGKKLKPNSSQTTLKMFVTGNQPPFPSNQHDVPSLYNSPSSLSTDNSPSLHYLSPSPANQSLHYIQSINTSHLPHVTATTISNRSIEMDPLSTGESCSTTDHFTTGMLLQQLDHIDPLQPINILTETPSVSPVNDIEKSLSASSLPPATVQLTTDNLSPVDLMTTSTMSTQSEAKLIFSTNKQVFQ
jgi:hypothetical protein